MDNYLVFADISNYLIRLLRETCVPEPISSVDKIGLATKAAKEEFLLYLSLYDVCQMDRGLFSQDLLPLTLKYFLKSESQAFSDMKAIEEARILGKAISTFANNPIIDGNSADNNGVPISIYMDSIDMDNKLKILGSMDLSGPAIFYSVAPVILRTESKVVAPRVRSTG